jgi:hypothetical protein
MPITGMSVKLSPKGSFLTMWLTEAEKEWFSSDQSPNKLILAWFLVWGVVFVAPADGNPLKGV